MAGQLAVGSTPPVWRGGSTPVVLSEDVRRAVLDVMAQRGRERVGLVTAWCAPRLAAAPSPAQKLDSSGSQNDTAGQTETLPSLHIIDYLGTFKLWKQHRLT